ncbi:hypothetical protein [Nocardia mexicana]|uniref:hypothetical protein n=1 Tax=Nocardia mexicana TaxID=279262 RepID=UPI00082FA69F|nr:hypothetical protein [Nocardia mexicana]
MRYEPHYLLYAVLFTLAVEGTAALASGVQWRPGGATVVRIAVVAIVLLYLRMVDEQKDLDYDREYHPDRPLVTGAVSARELRVAMGVIAVVAVGGSLALSVRSAVMISAALVYGLLLWGLERLSATVRDAVMVNLAVTYPVQLFIIGYVVASAIDTGQVGSGWAAAAVAVVFAGAFLQFEFARKTAREPRPGEMLYSNALGPTGSAVAGVLCAVLAVACDLILVRPWEYSAPRAVIAWIPLVLLVFPLWGAFRFASGGDSPNADSLLRTDGGATRHADGGTDAAFTSGTPARGDRGETSHPPYPLAPAVIFVLTLYAALITQAFVLS